MTSTLPEDSHMALDGKPGSERKRAWLACAILLVLPALLLFESLFLGNDFIPFDHRVFAPASAALEADDAAKIQDLRARANWQITEKTMLVVPEFELAKQELEAGRLPHYNPWVRSGAPLFANVLDGFAYPLHLPFFFGRIEARFALVAFLAFALAGLFMLGFLRELDLSWSAALFGAITFQLSGTLAANAHFYMRMETLAWLPAGFWALECYAKRQSLRAALAFALTVAMTWLAGFPPFALVCSLAFGARIATIGISNKSWRAFVTLGLAAILGLGLACVQLVPMLDYFPQAQRNLDQSLDELAGQGIDPLALLGLGMPFPFGSPIGSPEVPFERHPLIHLLWTRTSPTSGKLFFPTNFNYTEYAIYLGALPLVCAIVALFRRRRFRVIAFSAFTIAFVLAMGGVVFQSVAWLPVLKSTPPSRFVGLLCFFGAALAGIGFHTLTTELGRVGRRVAAVACGGAAAAAFAITVWSRRLADDPERANQFTLESLGAHWMGSYPEIAGDPAKLNDWFGAHAVATHRIFSHSMMVFAATLFAITIWMLVLPPVADRARRRLRSGLIGGAIAATALFLLIDARHVNPSFEPPPSAAAGTDATNPVLDFLRERRAAHAEDGGFTVARVAKAATLPIPLPPNLLIKEHIRDLNSYAFVDARSHLPFVALYGPGQMIRQYWVQALPVDARLQRKMYDLYGVRYWIAPEAFDALGEPVLVYAEGREGQTYVYERQDTLARAWLVAAARAATDDDAVVARLIAEDFDPRTELWLHDTVVAARDQKDATSEEIAAATVRFTRDEPTALTIEIENSPGAWLVLGDAVYDHWHARIDGEEREWHRANLHNRAIWIPRGNRVLTFEYDAKPFRYGAVMSILSILIVLLGFGWSLRRPKAPTEADDIATDRDAT